MEPNCRHHSAKYSPKAHRIPSLSNVSDVTFPIRELSCNVMFKKIAYIRAAMQTHRKSHEHIPIHRYTQVEQRAMTELKRGQLASTPQNIQRETWRTRMWVHEYLKTRYEKILAKTSTIKTSTIKTIPHDGQEKAPTKRSLCRCFFLCLAIFGDPPGSPTVRNAVSTDVVK